MIKKLLFTTQLSLVVLASSVEASSSTSQTGFPEPPRIMVSAAAEVNPNSPVVGARRALEEDDAAHRATQRRRTLDGGAATVPQQVATNSPTQMDPFTQLGMAHMQTMQMNQQLVAQLLTLASNQQTIMAKMAEALAVRNTPQYPAGTIPMLAIPRSAAPAPSEQPAPQVPTATAQAIADTTEADLTASIRANVRLEKQKKRKIKALEKRIAKMKFNLNGLRTKTVTPRGNFMNIPYMERTLPKLEKELAELMAS